MTNTLKFNPEEIAEALVRARGIRKMAAQIVGCNRDTISNYIDRFPACAKAAHEGRSVLLDDAEIGLLDELSFQRDPETGEVTKRPARWAIKWVLMTLGKERGYSWYPGAGAPQVVIQEQRQVIINQIAALPADERRALKQSFLKARELGRPEIPRLEDAVDGDFTEVGDE